MKDDDDNFEIVNALTLEELQGENKPQRRKRNAVCMTCRMPISHYNETGMCTKCQNEINPARIQIRNELTTYDGTLIKNSRKK